MHSIRNIANSFRRVLTPYKGPPLGRWTPKWNKQESINIIVDNSNSDHCGTCLYAKHKRYNNYDSYTGSTR